MATYLDESLRKLEEFEGSIPWMYRDTVGKVTIGVGVMLPDAAAALKLPLMFGETPATEAEIVAEYTRVDALPMGRPAMFYRRKHGPELQQSEIDALVRTVLLKFEEELRRKIAGYDDVPDGVKLALLDMAYNLGPAGLLREYPKMLRAIAEGAWAQAAAASFRHGPGAARNEWTRKMLLENVVGSVRAAAEGRVMQLFYGLVGLGAALLGRLRKAN